MLALPGWTIDNRNAIGFRISVNAMPKAARQAHQVCVVQCLLRSGQGLPPNPEAAGTMPHPEKSIQYDPIHTSDRRSPVRRDDSNASKSFCRMIVLCAPITSRLGQRCNPICRSPNQICLARDFAASDERCDLVARASYSSRSIASIRRRSRLRNPQSQDQGQSGHPCNPGQRSLLDHRHPTKDRTHRNFRGCASASPISESPCNHDRDATE
jgi:hypothetical protein